MTIQEQYAETKTSPALKWRSDRKGDAHYPYNWFDKVPLKVRTATTVSDQSAIQQAKIGEARKRHPEPTWEDILSLIDRCRDEMNQCTEPYRLR